MRRWFVCSLLTALMLWLCDGVVQVAHPTSQTGAPVDLGSPVRVTYSYRPDGATPFRPLIDGAAVRSGQELRLQLQARSSVYAYVLHKGSSGAWILLFPNQLLTADATAMNPLEPERVYEVPGRDAGLFLDDVPGTEEILVYAAPGPESTLETVARRMREGETLTIRLPDAIPRDPVPADRKQPRKLEEDSAKKAGDKPREGEVSVSFRDIRVVRTGTSNTVYLPAGPSVAHLRFRHDP